MVRAVNAVTVATKSGAESRIADACSNARRANCVPNTSRPVVLGGFALKNGWASHSF